MLNTTKKTVLALTLVLAPVSAFAQTTDTTNTTTPATTTAAGTNTGTTNTTSTQDNNRGFDYGWLGLLGLLGLAGLRRHTPVVISDRTTTNRV